eukprot:s496_g5.t2
MLRAIQHAAPSVSPIQPLLCQAALQRRWRRHPKGGRYGPQFHRFPTEVKMSWPPKDRSRLFLLPDSKRLLCVSHGWYYPNGITGKDNKKISTVLSVASRWKHNHMDSFTVDEVKALYALEPQIKAQFQECEAALEKEVELDKLRQHDFRWCVQGRKPLISSCCLPLEDRARRLRFCCSNCCCGGVGKWSKKEKEQADA